MLALVRDASQGSSDQPPRTGGPDFRAQHSNVGVLDDFQLHTNTQIIQQCTRLRTLNSKLSLPSQ